MKNEDVGDQWFEALQNGDYLKIALLSRSEHGMSSVLSNGNTPLMQAAIWGDVETVKYLIDLGADLNALNANGDTIVLHILKWFGHFPETQVICNMLIEAGCNVNVQSETDSPLSLAIQRRDINLARKLLEKGANPNPKCEYMYLPIVIASYSSDIQALELLFQYGADPNCVSLKHGHPQSPLYDAIGRDTQIVRFLLGNGADPNILELQGHLFSRIHFKMNEEDCFNTILDLIRAKADITIYDTYADGNRKVNSTLLHGACGGGHDLLVKTMIQYKYNIDARDRQGNTPLYYALLRGHVKCARMLIEARATLYNIDCDDEFALLMAAELGSSELIELILTVGSDVNHTNGLTALYLAIIKGHDHVVDLLLSKGADVHMHPNDVGSLLHEACTRGSQHIVNSLLSYGAEINMQDKQGMTPLMCATSYRNISIVKTLMQRGADPYMKDHDGNNAFDHIPPYVRDKRSFLDAMSKK